MARGLSILLAFVFIAATAAELDLNLKSEDVLPEGFEAESHSSRIIAGVIARRGQFPYQAALVVNRNGILTICSGALVSSKDVLSTSSCVGGATSVDVILGAQSIKNTTESGRLNIAGATVTTHPLFDIALVRLPATVQSNTYIKPIALPTYTEADTTMDGTMVYLTGWGRTSADGEFGISEELRYGTVRLTSWNVCQYFYPSRLLSTNICTETIEGKGACRGDAGSPVVTNNKLYGLVSFIHPQQCINCVPNVLTRTSYFLDWIEANSNVAIKV